MKIQRNPDGSVKRLTFGANKGIKPKGRLRASDIIEKRMAETEDIPMPGGIKLRRNRPVRGGMRFRLRNI